MVFTDFYNTRRILLNDERTKLNGWTIFLLVLIIFFGILRIAASTIVAYRCNYNENFLFKVIIVIFAFIFSEIYVPYFLIKYVILQKKCENSLFFGKKKNIRYNVNARHNTNIRHNRNNKSN